jgi:hypothetical protein
MDNPRFQQKIRFFMDGPTKGIIWVANESRALKHFTAAERKRLAQAATRDFPQPHRDALVWKYLDTYKFEDLLQQEALYLCQIAELARHESNEGIMNRFQEAALRKEFAHDTEQIEIHLRFYEELRQRAWVTCFSLGEEESPRMWEDYCKKVPNEGVVIRTTYRRLGTSFGTVSSLIRSIPTVAGVRYSENEEMMWKLGYLLYQKLPSFEFEQEVRVCVFSPDEGYLSTPVSPKHLYLPVRLMSLVRDVYVHPTASDEYFERIRALVETHLLERERRVEWSALRRTS